MPILLLILFIGIPAAEIALFIEVGGRIGLGWTLLSIVATAMIGTWLVRQQGLQTLARARAHMDRNQLPVNELIAGVCILVAGALLLTPGFLTDALGFILLIPPLRSALALAAISRMRRSGRFHVHQSGGPPPPGGRGPIIDGEFEEVDIDAPDAGPPNPDSPNPDSPWSQIDQNPNRRDPDDRNAQ